MLGSRIAFTMEAVLRYGPRELIRPPVKCSEHRLRYFVIAWRPDTRKRMLSKRILHLNRQRRILWSIRDIGRYLAMCVAVTQARSGHVEREVLNRGVTIEEIRDAKRAVVLLNHRRRP
jgi:hypothetical protein